MSASRGTSENGTGPAPPAIGMGRKDDMSKEGVPPVPTLDKEAGYGYGGPAPGQTAYGYNAIASPPAAARNIDYSQQRKSMSPTSPISPRGYADQYIAAIAEEEADQDPYGDQHEVDLKDGAGEMEHQQHQHQQQTLSPESKSSSNSGGKSSRSTKRVVAAESAAAREHGDPNERWKPSKPSPLAAAKAQEEAAKAQQAASAYAYGGSYGQPAGYADDHLDNANGPSEGLIVSHDAYNGGHAFDQTTQQQQQQQYGYATTERQSGQWSSEPQVQAQGDPSTSPIRGHSGQYTTDPYAGYHNGDKGKRWV